MPPALRLFVEEILGRVGRLTTQSATLVQQTRAFAGGVLGALTLARAAFPLLLRAAPIVGKSENTADQGGADE